MLFKTLQVKKINYWFEDLFKFCSKIKIQVLISFVSLMDFKTKMSSGEHE